MLSDSRFAQVIYNLRVADAYYYAEARYRRAAYRPTYHAKRRALQINLKVDTVKAAGMSSEAAYGMPCPPVIQAYSPVVESNNYVSTTGWVAGPTANDLLKLNGALAKHLARTTQHVVDRDGTCDRLIYPSFAYNVPHGLRSIPVHLSDTRAHSDMVSSDLSASTSTDTTAGPNIFAPLKIRINFKRKFRGDDDRHCYVEKRPRNGRKRTSA